MIRQKFYNTLRLTLLALSLLSMKAYANVNDINTYNKILSMIEVLEKKIEKSEQKQQKITKQINTYRSQIKQNTKISKELSTLIAQHQQRLAVQLRQLQRMQTQSLLNRIAHPEAYNKTQKHIQIIKQLPRLHINTITVLNPLNVKNAKINHQLNQSLKKLNTQQQKLKQLKQQLVAKQQDRKNQITHKKQLLKKAHILTYSQKKSTQKLLTKLKKTDLKNLSKLKHFRRYKGKLSWPAQGIVNPSKVTQNYSWEITGSENMPVYAIAPGKIEYVGRLGLLGKVIIINHGDNYRSVYKHLDAIQVREGQTVQMQQIISETGQSGGRDHYGISFELRHGRRSVNFDHWLKQASL